MASRAQAAVLRWLHHRNSSDYRELQEQIMLGCGSAFRGRSRRSWKTVPGLLVEDVHDVSSTDIEFDAVLLTDSDREMGKLSQERNLHNRNRKVQNSRKSSNRSQSGSANRRKALTPTKRVNPTTSMERIHHHKQGKPLDSGSFETTETEDESEQEEHVKGSKAVRWADCAGQALAVTHSIVSLPYITTRVVILLIDLNERLFEFVQCEFNTDNRLTVSDVLRQLPWFASITSLAQQRFRSLCRPDEEMINMLPLQHYQVREGEILVAGSDATPKEIMAAACTLLCQKKLVRAVHKAKLSGRALQRLMASVELAEFLSRDRTQESSGQLDEDEDEEGNDDASALIVKVLSRELGEEARDEVVEFADFSFPVFDPEDESIDNWHLLDSTSVSFSDASQDKTCWFEELLSHSYDNDGFQTFSEEFDPATEMHDSLSETATHNCTDDSCITDRPSENYRAWSEQDVLFPGLAFASLQSS